MPSHAELLGHAKRASAAGDFAGAERAYRAALAADPSRAETWQALAIARARQGRHETAVHDYREALRRQPTYAEAHNNLARSLEALGRLDEAVVCYQECLRLRPDLTQAHINLGMLLLGLKQSSAALTEASLAVELAPESPDALFLQGSVFSALGRHEDAVSALARAETLSPHSWDVAEKLGCTLWALGRWTEARAAFERALKIRPESSLSLGNLGLVLADLGLLDESLARFERSLLIDPTNHEFHRSRALVWLLRGEFTRGWPEYEWRFGCAGLPVRPFPRPLWDGSPLRGRSIMIHCEQGLGDTFQFLRYIPLVKERGGRVILICQPALKALLLSLPIADVLLAQGDPIPPFDVHAPLLSLPRIFGTTLETIPARIPYLEPDQASIDRWRTRVASVQGFKIGVAWQGSPKYRKDRERSFPLRRLAPLAALPNVRLISLQKGFGREQVAPEHARVPVIDFTDELDETTGPFLDTAAIIKSLDLVITPDTVHAHLAGALGAPVWVALADVPHWPWLLGRNDSPWYPSARLFRQPRRGNWESVFTAITTALSQLLPGD